MDDFREFRHNIGDTVKDCGVVLDTGNCLLAAYEMITSSLSKGEAATWQEVEAPMFAIRAMGGQFDPTDKTEVIPKILQLIPTLPNHPQIRYTSLLIISRYTEWIAIHPDYLQPQLQYVSSGFEETDQEIVGASVLALAFICKDCKRVSLPLQTSCLCPN
jgi:transportin-3